MSPRGWFDPGWANSEINWQSGNVIYIYIQYIHTYIYNIIVIVIIIVVIIIVIIIIVMIIINKYIYIYCSVIQATNFCEWCPHLRQNCSYIDSHVSHMFLSVPIVSLFVVGWCWLIAPASPWGTSRRGTRCRPKWPARRTCRPWNRKHPLQGGAPQVISWFVIPLTIDISPINHSYWSYKPT